MQKTAPQGGFVWLILLDAHIACLYEALVPRQCFDQDVWRVQSACFFGTVKVVFEHILVVRV